MSRRVLVTGSRGWNDGTAVATALRAQYVESQQLVVVHGQAPGADLIAGRWARWMANRGHDVVEDRHPAQWTAVCSATCWKHRKRRRDGSEYCPRQGSLRNQHMVDLGADICLGFPLTRSIGTFDCMRRARAAGIEVINYGVD